MWWQFRHRHTSYDGCPCSNSSADHNCCANDDGRRYDYCGSNYDCSTHDHSRTDYDSGPDDHSDGTNHHNLSCFINDCCFVSTRIG